MYDFIEGKNVKHFAGVGTLVGNFGEVKEVKDDHRVMSAVSLRVYVGKGKAEFFTLNFWDNKIDFYKDYIKNGAKVFITGTYTETEYVDRDKNKRLSKQVSVILLEDLSKTLYKDYEKVEKQDVESDKFVDKSMKTTDSIIDEKSITQEDAISDFEEDIDDITDDDIPF